MRRDPRRTGRAIPAPSPLGHFRTDAQLRNLGNYGTVMRKLLAPNTRAIGRPAGPPSCDAVPAAMIDGTPTKLRDDLVRILGDKQVLHRLIDLVRYAADASPYRLVPQVVVLPRNVADVANVLAYCRETGRHATFRAAGTSLNGQSQSDDVLIDVRRNWSGCSVEDGGGRLRSRPGTILAHANARLRKYGRRLGPDPASGHAATIGGVIANNAGGMRCTLQRDAYHTVSALNFVLPSGTIINTEEADAEERFAKEEPELASGLMALREELLADKTLAERIRHKYSIRNTHGYRLSALLDGTTPLQIFRRLLVGSEGTLAFIAEAVIQTLPMPELTTVAWLPFSSIDEAVVIVPKLVALGAEAVELMMAPALTAAGAAFPETPAYWKTLDPKAAALLVEYGAGNQEDLSRLEKRVADEIKDIKLLQPLEFITTMEAVELAWHVREGLLGIVGKMRPEGSMVITEDVCFPPERLAQGAHDLQALLAKHGFMPGVAGHAAHGNLHFTLIAKLDEEEGKTRYSSFMKDLVELVVRGHDGSLKAEHGTGINMAPFVTDEWGQKAVDMMWRIKTLADPKGVLAPDVILTRKSDVHLQSLKSIPAIENVTSSTQCIECGFCEPVCPSRNVTLTPRQRIVLRREMARQPADSPMLERLQDQYEYDGIQTCAGDGSCSIPCPIEINTGSLIKELRQKEHGARAEEVALTIAKNWATVEKFARVALRAADLGTRVAGVGFLKTVTGLARTAVSADLMPAVPGPMPLPASGKLPKTSKEEASAAYFPACINRMFGRDPTQSRRAPSLPDVLVALSARAGKPLWIPSDVVGLCCATPWSSKGYQKGHKHMAASMADALWSWSDGSRLPIVVDAASCTLGLVEDVGRHLDEQRRSRHQSLRIIDSVTWCRDLLPHLKITRRLGRMVVHPTCSMNHLGISAQLTEIACQLASDVEVPIGDTCCGTAGDRGLLHPELVVSATRDTKAALDSEPADAYISANRTCEMGLLHATGRPYKSFVYLLEELSRP
jgi:D-lactate dehydrogenase